MPRISILIPCYDAADTLPATFEMLSAQCFSQWEAICINDGSTDGTQAILNHAASRDPRIRVFSQPNAGPAIARNLAARMAQGEILAFLDADDLWQPDRLTRLIQHFDGSQAPDAVFGKTAFFTTDPTRPGSHSTVPIRPLTVETLLGENPVCTMSNIAVTTSAFAKTGGFDSRMAHAEDLDWLIRLVATGAVVSGDAGIVTCYRASTGGLSANLEAMHHGWRRAVRTACQIDPWITPQQVRDAEAIHLRYLGRRALRMDAPPRIARCLVQRALQCSARAFFSSPRRGFLTLTGALLAPILPGTLRRAVFSN